MTSGDKVAYVRSLMEMVASSGTYQGAYHHAIHIRGVMTAWNLDNTFPLDEFRQLGSTLQYMLETKLEMESVNA